LTYIELAWVAGLLEGEGSFISRRTKTGYQISIQCRMNDKDIIERLQKLVDKGNIYNAIDNHANGWAWHLSTKDDVFKLAKQLRLYMGQRRQKQIDAIIETYPKIKSLNMKPFCLKNIKTGEIVSSFGHKKFCDEYNLDVSHIGKVIFGKRKSYKGWIVI